MNKQEVVRIIRDAFGEGVEVFVYGDSIQFDLTWLPSLPKIINIANDLGVPYENVEILASNGSSGCDTCGYGSTVDFEWKIQR